MDLFCATGMRGEIMLPIEIIERKIYLVRGQKVMLDRDLAEMYCVPTKQLNQQVRRNISRFPRDFMFQLTAAEDSSLRSQIVTSKKSRGGRRYAPFGFTEQGIAMLSSVLKSERAIQVNIAIMRTFVRLRDVVSNSKELAKRLNELETKSDANFQAVFEAIREMIEAPTGPQRRIGFTAGSKSR
jgi:hypothetical protein